MPANAALPAAILEDLGLDPDQVVELGAEGPRAFESARIVETEATAVDASLAPRADEVLGDGVLLLVVRGQPSDAQLAAHRNALWPALHAVALYRPAGGGLVRETPSGSQRREGTLEAGALYAFRRRPIAMSPRATVEKFDQNASGWNGVPGGPGYPHFRWMRRFVGTFAKVEDGDRILDFGSGAGWVGIEAAKRARDTSLCAFDPSPEMVRIVEENARSEGITRFTGRTGFGEDPPFPAEGEPPFDLVISSGVVSFSPDVERWLDGLARTVAPGGRLVVGDIHRESRGFRRRRREKPVLPARELNAQLREDVRRGLEGRGFRFEEWCGYQLTSPVPQAMHVNETKLRGALTWPLLWANQLAAAMDRRLGARWQGAFDSWVMRLRREE